MDDKIINEAGAQEETPESGIKIVVEEDPNSEMAGASKVCAEDNHKDVPKEE